MIIDWGALIGGDVGIVAVVVGALGVITQRLIKRMDNIVDRLKDIEAKLR